jgi:hypothetical protein
MAPDLSSTFYDQMGLRLDLGGEALYMGWVKPIRSMSERGQPMVRSATLGFVGAENLPYDGNPPRSLPIGHILDCRSWEGFSGAPCWVHVQVPYTPPDSFEPPRILTQLAQAGIVKWAGDTLSVVGFFGMLVAYTTNSGHGVGIVTPGERIVDLILDDEELVEIREQAEEKERRRRDAEGIQAIASPPPSQTSFLDDLERATRRLADEPDQEPKRTSE